MQTQTNHADQFSYAEMGALLIAVGTEMIQSNVSAITAHENLGGRVHKTLLLHGITGDLAHRLSTTRLSDITRITKAVRRRFSNRVTRDRTAPN